MENVVASSSQVIQPSNVEISMHNIADGVIPSTTSSEVTSNTFHASPTSSLSSLYCLYLQTIKDNWSSCHAARLLTAELLEYVLPRFINCSTPLKVRILTSFLFLKPQMRENCKVTLCKVLRIGEVDGDEWVRKLSRIMIPYVTTGIIDLKETDTETVFKIISFLDEQKCLLMNKGFGDNAYRLKPGLESTHLCFPYSGSNEQNNEEYEYELFSPTGNFDMLLSNVVKEGLEAMYIANGIKTKKTDHCYRYKNR